MSDFVSLTRVGFDEPDAELLERHRNIKSILGISSHTAKSFIVCSGNRRYHVKETPAEIKEKIRQSRLSDLASRRK